MKSAKVQIPPKNKHQAKTEATRRDLLDAAEKIFARDGYERTQIETIAAAVGRTKGAVYAHFKGKEDLFLALFERKIRNHIATVQSWPEDLSMEDLVRAARKLFISSSEEESWPILLLEFKLFALRNTGSMERIQEVYQLLYAGLPTMDKRSKTEQKQDFIVRAILRGIPSAIALERHFDPRLQSSHAVKEALAAAFDALALWRLSAPANPKVRKLSVKSTRGR